MSELADVSRGILLLDRGSEELLEQGSSIKGALYAVDLKVKRLLHKQTSSPKLSGVCHASTGVKLPKISVPRFDGNIMNWTSFWEQFEVSIQKKENLEDVEKLALPEECLEGWIRQSWSSKDCRKWQEIMPKPWNALQESYDQHRLIHQAHVRASLEAPTPKGWQRDGSYASCTIRSTNICVRLRQWNTTDLTCSPQRPRSLNSTSRLCASGRNLAAIASPFPCTQHCSNSLTWKQEEPRIRWEMVNVGVPAVMSGKKTSLQWSSYAVNLDDTLRWM